MWRVDGSSGEVRLPGAPPGTESRGDRDWSPRALLGLLGPPYSLPVTDAAPPPRRGLPVRVEDEVSTTRSLSVSRGLSRKAIEK